MLISLGTLFIGETMFVKYGDGHIASVFDEQELTEEQKKSAEALSKKNVKKAENEPEIHKLESK